MILTFGSILGILLHLKRTCPKCRQDQIVPTAKRHQTVLCRFCKTEIQPPKKRS